VCIAGPDVPHRALPGAYETGDVPVCGGYRAVVWQHSRDRTVSEALLAQPRGRGRVRVGAYGSPRLEAVKSMRGGGHRNISKILSISKVMRSYCMT